MSARDEAKQRVLAKVQAEKALPPRERLANMLHATHTHADAAALLDAFRADVLREAARVLEATDRDDDAVNLLDLLADAA